MIKKYSLRQVYGNRGYVANMCLFRILGKFERILLSFVLKILKSKISLNENKQTLALFYRFIQHLKTTESKNH